MRTLPAGSVDAVITDPPYSVLTYQWDSAFNLGEWWAETRRVLKSTGTAVVFSSQPFASDLICSNREWFKQEIVWHKPRASGFIHAKNALMKAHENILVFSGGVINHKNRTARRMTFNPQMVEGKPYKMTKRREVQFRWNDQSRPSQLDKWTFNNVGERFPRSVVEFDNHNGGNEHPTQKPVDLIAWLVATYTDVNETVLDCFMGSGTTGVACVQTGRNFIGVEIDPTYYAIAERRIREAEQQPALALVE